MNIIKTSNYEGDYICSICRDQFKDTDTIFLIKHFDDTCQKSEKIDKSRKRRHIFHETCITEYIQENCNDENKYLCPFDREVIDKLIAVKYCEIVALNIVNFSNNYYELLDKFNNRDVIHVSIIDRINLNYKDINGKTLLYCACQRGNIKLVKQVIKLGGHSMIPDDNGFTPLMACITHNFLPIVKYLLSLSEIINTINHVDDQGKTAIEYACQYHRLNCVLTLLKVEGINSDVLKKLLNYYKSIKYDDINYNGCYETICKITTKLRKYLMIPIMTKIQIKQLGFSEILKDKTPKTYRRSEPDNPTKVLNVDINNDPDLFEVIYQPLETQNLIIPKTNDNELKDLINYNEMNPDLIYKNR